MLFIGCILHYISLWHCHNVRVHLSLLVSSRDTSTICFNILIKLTVVKINCCLMHVLIDNIIFINLSLPLFQLILLGLHHQLLSLLLLKQKINVGCCITDLLSVSFLKLYSIARCEIHERYIYIPNTIVQRGNSIRCLYIVVVELILKMTCC